MRTWLAPTLLLLLLTAPSASGGLYYSGESYAALPSQWRGFLLDQRVLRNIAARPTKTQEASPLRVAYQKAAEVLQARLQREHKLPADDWADLGALYVRLGEPAKAVAVLRDGLRAFPNHFTIAANLGTAWQLAGDLSEAAGALQQAVRLAPGKWLAAEELHVKLVRLRLKQGTPVQELDDLFGVRYGGGKGEYTPGRLADAERKKLPDRAVALVQQLALWLSADGRLLWQLAELAAAHGDIGSAAAMADGCVVQYGMTGTELRQRRLLLREAADALAKAGPGVKADHARHGSTLAFRSIRPLLGKFDTSALPPISATGVNPLPWELFLETKIEKPFRPAFAEYLRQLEGKQVALTGFMVPLRDDVDATAFMFIENPVGCWYCEMPETTGIVYVEMPAGQAAPWRRGLLRVVGRLTLNRADPEDFLYAIRDARIGPVD
jgi:tetratricopeptide (TPR) repeat protein